LGDVTTTQQQHPTTMTNTTLFERGGCNIAGPHSVMWLVLDLVAIIGCAATFC
jgi:hypothetical protein